jgi:hypothetical protein
MRLMDGDLPSQSELYASQLAAKLQTFGDRPKRGLLRRAGIDPTKITSTSDVAHRRMTIADAVLGKWENWTEADLPAIPPTLDSKPQPKFMDALGRDAIKPRPQIHSADSHAGFLAPTSSGLS